LKTDASPTPTPILRPLSCTGLDGFSLGSPRNRDNVSPRSMVRDLQNENVSEPGIYVDFKTPNSKTRAIEVGNQIMSEYHLKRNLIKDDSDVRMRNRSNLNKLFFLFLDRLTDLHLQKIMQQELNETGQELSDDEETPETLFHWRNAMKKLNNSSNPLAPSMGLTEYSYNSDSEQGDILDCSVRGSGTLFSPDHFTSCC